MTGLPGRALLADRVQQAIDRPAARGVGYSLLIVDLDRFRALNEVHGYATGDEVLREVAATLSVLAGPSDVVGRYVGGVFAVLVDGCGDRDEAEAAARRVLTGLNAVLTAHGAGPTSVCVGVAHGPADDAESLFAAGRAAVTRAKARGRGRIHVLQEGREPDATWLALRAGLPSAVAGCNLAVFYQPIVHLATGRIVGFEALVRWPHERLGLLSAGAFLDAAHELDLQDRIDEWVLPEACSAARSWQASDRRLTVAVNVTPSRLSAPGFADAVRSALRDSGLCARALVLEVTETALVADTAQATGTLEELRGLGVHVSIDDFGTGYSSMLQLRQLPFDKLKIDREFVRGLPGSEDDQAICASMITLADRVGLETIAEGVELAEHREALLELGCTFGQGFLWSPAVPARQAADLSSSQPWVTRSTVAGWALPAAPDLMRPSSPGAGSIAW